MKRIVLFFLVASFISFSNYGQRSIPADTTIITQHVTTINGTKLNYTATCGTQPVWDENGQPIATLFYTYYKKSNGQAKERPLVISFNGGPGSASVWMHIAYTGPKALNIDAEGYPVQPYGVHENKHSILDTADIVFINPVNTGYSRTIPESGPEIKRELFFGINADINYLAEWLTTFVSRFNRWESPKFLIGESYGGTRVSGLALALQEKQWMYLNGVILVSPADYNVLRVDNPIYHAINLPYYTATAWYHKKLPKALQDKDLLDVLPEVEAFTINTLLPTLAIGGSASKELKQDIAQKMANYSGLSKKSILQYNLRVPNSFFWKELLRDDSGHTVGRLDSRYLGLDKTEAGSSSDFNPEITAWLHAFAPAINYYLRNELNFITDVKYNMFGPVHPWDRRNNNTRDDLRKAMASNPFLNVLFQSGYYDGATTYFNAKYTMWQMDPSGKLQDRMQFKGYRSGHMMYLRNEDLKSANDDLREFIKNSLPQGKSARY